MGVSIGNRQADMATMFKSFETFRVCRKFWADHFGTKFFNIRLYCTMHEKNIKLHKNLLQLIDLRTLLI